MERKCPAWNFFAIFGELQHENINCAWCHAARGRQCTWRGELQTVVSLTCTPLTSFLPSENWKVHYSTRISHPAPPQTAPAFSKTDVVEQVRMTVNSVRAVQTLPQGMKTMTNLDKKSAINFKVDDSMSSWNVFHHTVLLQLENTRYTLQQKYKNLCVCVCVCYCHY